jgi:hypothetical protein
VAARGSTRLAIVEQALADTLERLDELPDDPRVRALKVKASGYQRAAHAWATTPPSDEQRSAMVDSVLELNISVMRLAEDLGAL